VTEGSKDHSLYTRFFYKNLFYKNVEDEINQILRSSTYLGYLEHSSGWESIKNAVNRRPLLVNESFAAYIGRELFLHFCHKNLVTSCPVAISMFNAFSQAKLVGETSRTWHQSKQVAQVCAGTLILYLDKQCTLIGFLVTPALTFWNTEYHVNLRTP